MADLYDRFVRFIVILALALARTDALMIRERMTKIFRRKKGNLKYSTKVRNAWRDKTNGNESKTGDLCLFRISGREFHESTKTLIREPDNQYEDELNHNYLLKERNRNEKKIQKLEHGYNITDDIVSQGSRIPKVPKLLRYYVLFFNGFFIFLVFKYFILNLLELEMLASYRWIDCYLIGRASMTGRFAVFSNYLSFVGALAHLTWHAVVYLKQPRLKIDCIEFLFYDLGEVVAEEARSRKHLEKIDWNKQKRLHQDMLTQQQHRTRISNRINLDERFMNHLVESPANEQQNEEYNSIFYILDTVGEPGESKTDYLFRPNRTARSWIILARSVTIATVVYLSIMLPVWSSIAYVLWPLLITHGGFELTNHLCVSWIRKLPNHMWPEYDYIYPGGSNLTYVTRKSKTAIVGMTRIRPFNLFNVLRFICDVLETCSLWINSTLVFSSNMFILILCTVDLLNYARPLIRRLKKLIAQAASTGFVSLTFSSQLTQAANLSVINEGYSSINPAMIDLLSETIDGTDITMIDKSISETMLTQKLIVDWFGLVNKYNYYASYFSTYWIIIWILYGFIACGYYLGAANPWEVIEYYYLEFVMIFTIVALIGVLGLTMRSSRRLYRLIASAMATDRCIAHTKARWTIISEYYFPIPLDCFTLSWASEISWLFGFKLMAWMFSAALVSSTLYSVYESKSLYLDATQNSTPD